MESSVLFRGLLLAILGLTLCVLDGAQAGDVTPPPYTLEPPKATPEQLKKLYDCMARCPTNEDPKMKSTDKVCVWNVNNRKNNWVFTSATHCQRVCTSINLYNHMSLPELHPGACKDPEDTQKYGYHVREGLFYELPAGYTPS